MGRLSCLGELGICYPLALLFHGDSGGTENPWIFENQPSDGFFCIVAAANFDSQPSPPVSFAKKDSSVWSYDDFKH